MDASAVIIRGISSVGRAPALHAGSQEFESPILHGRMPRMFMIEVIRSYSPEVNHITWQDVFEKLQNDSETGEYCVTRFNTESVIAQNEDVTLTTGAMPSIVAEGDYKPESFFPVCDRVYDHIGFETFHTYVSFAQSSSNFGGHEDETDVLIVQGIGVVTYRFDDGQLHTLLPGDAVYIQAGVWHKPEVLTPRCTLSFSM